jgi:P-type E1-E2 ATPase
VAFDKTGTLTKGKLSVDTIHPTSKDYSEEALIAYAASGEQESSHILARSLVAYAKDQKMTLYPVSELEEVTGQGIQAIVEGKKIRVGKAAFAGSAVSLSKEKTAVFVSIEGESIGYITFTDVVRKESAETIKALKELGIKKTIMLTGDHQVIADQIAREVGITEVHAECLPEEKINVIKTLSEADRPGIMVGDGINDAPALGVADIGIAMGAHGSTAASESADAVILKDDLSRVSEAVRLSQDTMRIARQSVLIGIVICVVLMLIASTGVIPALLGAALQEVIDTVSILSALRARKDN